MHRTSLIVDLDDWVEFDRIAKRRKTDRASLLRQFIREQIKDAR
jgi:hypothetical protein